MTNQPKPLVKEEEDVKIRTILLKNFDNGKYLWSIAHKELKSLLASQKSQWASEVRKELVKETTIGENTLVVFDKIVKELGLKDEK